MANKIELRQINKNTIFRRIYAQNGISKQDLALQTGLSMPTVTQNLKELQEEGLIMREGEFQSTGGRRAQIIRCVPGVKLAVGIDITQNHITIVIIDLAGRIVCGGLREAFPYKDEPAYYDAVAEKLEKILDQNRIDRSRILGTGISLPCIVNRETNRLSYSEVIKAPPDIQDAFAGRIPYQVEIFNDANAGGTAEMWVDHENQPMMFYLMLSNSVGGAIILDGKFYSGQNYRSAEIGHLQLVPGGRPCYCGQLGCVNAYCSAKLLSDQAGGKLELFFERLEQQDASAKALFDEYLDSLAATVKNLRMLFDCNIILGGYVGAYMDRYMDPLRQLLGRIDPYDSDGAYVRPCSYKIEASAVGAALYFIEDFIQKI